MKRFAGQGATILRQILTAVVVAAVPLTAQQSSARSASAPSPVRIARCGGFLEGITVDQQGRLWVMDVTGGRILEVRPDGVCVERARTGGHPNGARLAADGRLFVADWSGLLSFDPRSFALEKVPLRFGDEPLVGLNDLAFDRKGGLYITVPGKSDALTPNGRVFYRSPDGRVSLVTGNMAYPNGVAVAPDGQTILVSDFARRRILSLPAVDAASPLKLSYVFAQSDSGIGADGLLFDDTGRLLAANFGSREVQAIGRDGRTAWAVDLPVESGDLVTNIALGGSTMYVTEARKGEIWRIARSDRSR